MSALPPSLSPAKTPDHFTTSVHLQLQQSLSLLELCKYTLEFKQVHAKLTKLGHIANPLALTRLLCYSSISRHSDIQYSQSIFNLDQNPNTFAYNVLIRGYAQSEYPEKALPLFYDMICNANSAPNQLTFPFLFKACSAVKAVKEGKQIHGLVLKYGLSKDLFVQNSLISLYSACGCIDYAYQVFDKIAEPDIFSKNTIIRGLVESGYVEEARLVFDEMPNRNLVTWNCMVDGYVKVGLLKQGRELFDQIEGKDSISWNTLISGYVRSDLMEDARTLFNQMPSELKDLITFNLMIDGYARDGEYGEVLHIFREVQKANVELNKFTIVSVLTACSNLAALDQGEWIETYIQRNGINVDAILGTALADMFAKCGHIKRALSVFESMEEMSVESWNSMIHNLGVHGYGQEALTMFSDMLKFNIQPDEITFVCLLSACRHSGLVDEGKKYFRLMSEEYDMVPKVEHYGCMVDLFCRANMLEEARCLIETSRMTSSVPMWGALLGASCRLGNMAMGEYAAERILELDPFDGSCYIVLSNMYSAAGLYEKAREVRKMMNDQGIDKVPGSSSIEIDGWLHEFRISSSSPALS
ncbi:pentatricopeptide repeat-containing protein At2g29760, chloroplastic-like [Mercurialis annua]|uniref:pentatricopeptide repeat-containing protein At2g29760, chloroplastic-like n=1 Tax=Mercurialis annua TaxID=3986 RepID=UPI00215DF8EE|nr:pentatricopeptide repeat-containing protein At2g29760, chloroplastic-like [Mercurialis annua]